MNVSSNEREYFVKGEPKTIYIVVPYRWSAEEKKTHGATWFAGYEGFDVEIAFTYAKYYNWNNLGAVISSVTM